MLVDPVGQEVPFVYLFTVSPPMEDCMILGARRLARGASPPELHHRHRVPDRCQVRHFLLQCRQLVVEHQHLHLNNMCMPMTIVLCVC